MPRYLAGRLLSSVVVLWAIVTVSFLLMRFAPGSPFDADRRLPASVEANKWMVFGLGEELVAPVDGTVVAVGAAGEGQEIEAGALVCAIDRLGLDPVGRPRTDAGERVEVTMPRAGRLVSVAVVAGQRVHQGERLAVVPRSLLAQYLTTLGRYARLDFGVTLSSDGQRTVAEELAAALPVSAELGLWALLLALLLGVSAGIFAGLRQNTWVDHAVMSVAMVGISVPTIVSGPVLIAVFAVWLGVLPAGGWESWPHRVLPVVTLALVYTAAFARLTRGGMLEVVRSDFIRTARAKGLGERAIVLRHAFKGAILPTVSFLGPAAAQIVTGSIVVEKVFGIAGLGDRFITPALNRDYPMVLGVVVVYSVVLVVANLLVDLAYAWLDPRVSYER